MAAVLVRSLSEASVGERFVKAADAKSVDQLQLAQIHWAVLTGKFNRSRASISLRNAANVMVTRFVGSQMTIAFDHQAALVAKKRVSHAILRTRCGRTSHVIRPPAFRRPHGRHAGHRFHGFHELSFAEAPATTAKCRIEAFISNSNMLARAIQTHSRKRAGQFG
jgi:hypothetical protein